MAKAHGNLAYIDQSTGSKATPWHDGNGSSVQRKVGGGGGGVSHQHAAFVFRDNPINDSS